VEHALLFLEAPTNIEKKVRELQLRLYREWKLASALALPVMIPLCFVQPPGASGRPAEIRELLRRGVGGQAPYLRSGSILEAEGYLFWELGPREDLRRLEDSCARVFARAGDGEPDRLPGPRPEAGESSVLQALFPTGRGFYLGSVEGRSLSSLPTLHAPEPLLFPAKEAVLLRFHPLGEQEGNKRQTAEGSRAPESRRWWGSLFWEELERIPLRKRPGKPNKP
jgi:hypothetical protein